MTPPSIIDIADWIAGDAAAAYRAHCWALAAGYTREAWYALGHLHALEARDGRAVPR